jgi:hypothetical protein
MKAKRRGKSKLPSRLNYIVELLRLKRTDFLTKEHPGVIAAPGRSEARELFDEEHGKDDRRRRRFSSLDVVRFILCLFLINICSIRDTKN